MVKIVTVMENHACKACNGSGKNAKGRKCSACGGTGSVEVEVLR